MTWALARLRPKYCFAVRCKLEELAVSEFPQVSGPYSDNNGFYVFNNEGKPIYRGKRHVLWCAAERRR